MMRCIAAPKRVLGDVALEKIRANANATYNGDLVKACCANEKAKVFGNQIKSIQEEVHSPLAALDIAIATTGYRGYIEKKYAKDKNKVESKLENLKRLRTMIEGMLAEADMTTDDLVFQLSMEKVPEDDAGGCNLHHSQCQGFGMEDGFCLVGR